MGKEIGLDKTVDELKTMIKSRNALRRLIRDLDVFKEEYIFEREREKFNVEVDRFRDYLGSVECMFNDNITAYLKSHE